MDTLTAILVSGTIFNLYIQMIQKAFLIIVAPEFKMNQIYHQDPLALHHLLQKLTSESKTNEAAYEIL